VEGRAFTTGAGVDGGAVILVEGEAETGVLGPGAEDRGWAVPAQLRIINLWSTDNPRNSNPQRSWL
jgi:hypothetical protein